MIGQMAEVSQATLREPYFLIRRRANDQIEILIDWGGYSMADDATLLIRLGDAAAQRVRYGLSTDNEATFLRGAESILEQLKQLDCTDAIVAQAERRTGVTSVARWRVGDLHDALHEHLGIE